MVCSQLFALSGLTEGMKSSQLQNVSVAQLKCILGVFASHETVFSVLENSCYFYYLGLLGICGNKSNWDFILVILVIILLYFLAHYKIIQF